MDELAQRRRQKILARATEEDLQKQQQAQTSGKGDVFQRYQKLKDRTAAEEQLNHTSKGTGLLIVFFSFVFTLEATFSAVLVFMIGLTLRINYTTNPPASSTNLFSSFGRMGILLDKFHFLQRAMFVGKIVLNVLFSYILAVVLINTLSNAMTRLTHQLQL